MRFFILSVTLICAQLVGAGGAGGAGTDDEELITAVMHQAPDPTNARLALTSQESLNAFAGAKAATTLYDLNNSGRFRCPYPNEDPLQVVGIHSALWIADLDGHGSIQLTANRQIAPSIALSQLLLKGGVITPQMAQGIVIYTILLEIAGNAGFDSILQGSPLQIPSFQYQGTVAIGYGVPKHIGTFGSLTNIYIHSLMNPRRLAGNNIFCIGANEDGDPLYLGFRDFFRTPKTENALREFLYSEFLLPIQPSGDEIRDSTMNSLQAAYTNVEYWNRTREEEQSRSPVWMFDIDLLRRVLHGGQTTTPVVEAQDDAACRNQEFK